MFYQIDISAVNDICISAGNAILKIYTEGDYKNHIDYKKDDSPLTIADKAAHEIIMNGLTKLTPEIPVISEEGSDIPFSARSSWEYFWLVDPLDGTKEFIKRNGEFTVNIALIHHKKAVAGSIFIPVTGQLYYATTMSGAFKEGHGGKEQIKVSSKKENLTAIGSRSHSTESETSFLKDLPIEKSITAGSSLKFCYIAEGKADLYYREGPTMEWDTAAGQAIVEIAGGTVQQLNHQPFLYNKTSLLNPGFICNGSGLDLF